MTATYHVKRWAEIFPPGAPQTLFRVRNAVMDFCLTPIMGDVACLERLYYNPLQFIQNFPTTPIFAGGSSTDRVMTLPQAPIPTRRIAGRSVLVGSTSNFGHHVINHLPRLKLALQMGLAVDNFIIGDNPKFVRGFAELLGAPLEKFVAIARDEIVVVDDMIVLPMPYYGTIAYNANNKIIGLRILHDKFYPSLLRDSLCRLSDNPKKRLFLVRGQMKWRNLLNEQAVIDALAPLGVEPYVAEAHTMAHQLETIGAAELVVCPVGAGVALAAFAPKTARVLFLEPPEIAYNGGQWATEALDAVGVGHEHLSAVALLSPDRKPPDSDYIVDVDKTVAAVARMIGAPTLALAPAPPWPPTATATATATVESTDSLRHRLPLWSQLHPHVGAPFAVQIGDAALDRALAPVCDGVAYIDGVSPVCAEELTASNAPLFAGAVVTADALLLARSPLAQPLAPLPGASILIGPSDSFEAFVLHSAPRLAMLLDVADAPRFRLMLDRYLIGPRTPFAMAFFALAGAPEKQVTAIEGDAVHLAERLTMTPSLCRRHPHGGWTLHPAFPARMRARFGRAGAAPTPGRRLVVSGADAAAGAALATALGVEPLSTQTTPLDALLTAVGAAEQLFPVDGDALAACLFAAPGATVTLAPAAMRPWFPPCAERIGLSWRVATV